MNFKKPLSGQQFHVFQAVNSLGYASAREVQKIVEKLNLAHSTVATVLSRLEKKGLLASEIVGRERKFRCLVEEGAIYKSMVQSLVSTVFDGNSKALMAHLVQEGEINSIELDELKELIQRSEEND